MNVIRQITEKTALPISLVISILVGVVWLTKLSSSVETNANAIEGAVLERKEVVKDLQEMKSDIKVIKHILEEEKE